MVYHSMLIFGNGDLLV